MNKRACHAGVSAQLHLESIPDEEVDGVNLVRCKAQAETHYDNFMRLFRP